MPSRPQPKPRWKEVSFGLRKLQHAYLTGKWSAARPCLGPMGSIGACGSCRCCRRPPRSSTPWGWKVTWSESPTSATGHPRPAPCKWCHTRRCRRPSNRPRSTGWSAPASAAASRSTGSTPRPSATCAPTWVLSQDLCAVCAVPSGHVNQTLDVLGCQAEVISLDPSSLDEVLDGVLQVGKAAGAEQRAEEVVHGLDAARAARQRPSCGRGAGAALGVRPRVG